ncbi:MAG: DNA polymerase I, partial [Bacteroidetes bacterium]|nr:DNA polymerase I [Bacteroidota bacterium]
MKKKIFAIIDGNAIIHRAYHAIPPMSVKDGTMVNAVYGFTSMLLKVINDLKPDYIAVSFDVAGGTFRDEIYEDYKATRVKADQELYDQIPLVHDVVEAFNIPIYINEGFEADDLIATLASKAVNSSLLIVRRGSKKKPMNDQRSTINVTILSGDRDVLQLVNGSIKVQMPGWNLKETSLYGESEVKEKFGITPAQMVDYKSLMGDTSDNIPGIAGIGPKTASNLLIKYKTLENLFKHVDEIEGLVKDKLKAGKDDALKAKRLVELDRKVDIKFEV